MSLQVQYRFDEATGSLGTDSVGSLDMTNSLGLTSGSASGTVYTGNAAYFDGSSYITLPEANVPVYITADNDRTFSAWINSSGNATRISIHINGTSDLDRRYKATIDPSGAISVGISGTITTGSIITTSNEWFHYVSTFNGTTNLQKIYVNGVEDISQTRSGTNTHTTGDLNIGFDSTQGTQTNLTGYMSDFRIYDGDIDATAVAQLYAEGPLGSFLMTPTMYTHMVDLSWLAVSGATTYTVTQSENSGTPEVIADDVTELTTTSLNLTPGLPYEFSLYTDLDIVTPVVTTTGTAPTVSTSTVTDLLVRLSNDLTELTQTSIDEIEAEYRNILSTGDELIFDTGNFIFVGDSDSLEHVEGKEGVMTPFEPLVGSGQTVTVTTSEGDSETVTYDESLNEVTIGGTTLSVGGVTVIGKYKVRVAEI